MCPTGGWAVLYELLVLCQQDNPLVQGVAWDVQHPALLAVETAPLGTRNVAHNNAPNASNTAPASTSLPAAAQTVVQAGPAVVLLLAPTPTKVLPHTVEPLQLGWGLFAAEAPYLWLHSPLVQYVELGPGGPGALGGAPSKVMLSMYKGNHDLYAYVRLC